MSTKLLKKSTFDKYIETKDISGNTHANDIKDEGKYRCVQRNDLYGFPVNPNGVLCVTKYYDNLIFQMYCHYDGNVYVRIFWYNYWCNWAKIT